MIHQSLHRPKLRRRLPRIDLPQRQPSRSPPALPAAACSGSPVPHPPVQTAGVVTGRYICQPASPSTLLSCTSPTTPITRASAPPGRHDPPDRILSRPKFPRHRLVDDHHRILGIVPLKIPPLLQPHPHRRQIPRRNDEDERPLQLTRPILHPLRRRSPSFGCGSAADCR